MIKMKEIKIYREELKFLKSAINAFGIEKVTEIFFKHVELYWGLMDWNPFATNDFFQRLAVGNAFVNELVLECPIKDQLIRKILEDTFNFENIGRMALEGFCTMLHLRRIPYPPQNKKKRIKLLKEYLTAYERGELWP